MAATPPAAESTETRIKLRRRLRVMFGLLLLLVLMGVNLAIGAGKLMFEKVTSESMEPTLLVGDVLLCDAGAAYGRGNVVVLDDPQEVDGLLVKRIIAMPGDQVLIDHGVLYLRRVGERDYKEQYSQIIRGNKMIGSDGRWRIGADEIFVLGDNRNFSLDSRDFGPVPIASLRGAVIAVVWPPDRWSRPPRLDDTPEQ